MIVKFCVHVELRTETRMDTHVVYTVSQSGS